LQKLCSGALIEQQVGEKIGFSLLRWGYFGVFGLGVERTIAWLTAFFYDGRGSDIASWLSIVLAILVFVYMFYQHAQSERNTSEMRGLIHKGQQIIVEKAGQ